MSNSTNAAGNLDAKPAIAVQGLTKRFEDIIALDDVSFDLDRGELFGFIGPDGAGKTTLFRVLATLLVPDAGSAHVLGLDVVPGIWELRKRIGYMPGRFSLYPDLSVGENLEFFASVFGTTVEAEYEQIAPIYSQLAPFRDRRAGALSGGMKQKLALCCALVHRPELLLLDEPTTGVDAVSRREFWELLARIRSERGLTIIVATPYMDEASRCDRVALIQRGRVLAIDTPLAITRSYERPLLAVSSVDRYGALRALRDHPHAFSVFLFGEVLHYSDTRVGHDADAIAHDLRSFLADRGVAVSRIASVPASIEDVFMARMGDPDTAPERNVA